jgi:uncharacterized protein (TIGR02466 family)
MIASETINSKEGTMPIGHHEARPLFVEPYLRVDLGQAITGDQIEFVKSLKMVQNQVNLISENLYIFEEPELKSIKDAVREALQLYAREVMGIPHELYVTQSWSLINQPGVGMHGHTHSNSVVSGSLYFCEMPEPPARMIFDRHRTYQQLELLPQQGKVNLFNTTKNVVEPKQNELILFSSSIHHFVEPNGSTQPRYSIAFNTFVRGKLGSYRDVSELVL